MSWKFKMLCESFYTLLCKITTVISEINKYFKNNAVFFKLNFKSFVCSENHRLDQ